MKINLITQSEFDSLKSIYEQYPALTLNNKGYEYIDKSKLSKEDLKAFQAVTEILQKSVFGFGKFSNFRDAKGKIEIRMQYDYNYDCNCGYFVGVGYIYLDELLNGFE